MCGILGIVSKKNCVQEALEAFELLTHRGKDCFGISDGKRTLYARKYQTLKKGACLMKSKMVLMHNLHSITSFQPQPIEHCFLTNCEIYNTKEFLFDANDAKTLYLLIKNDFKNLERVRGPYAFAYRQKNSIILARDILGEKPLLYGKTKNKIVFASEGKAIKKLGMEPIHLDPKTIAIINTNDITLKFKKRNFFSLEGKQHKDEKKAVKKLKKLLLASVKIMVPQQKLGILFSGGLDSLLLTCLCKKLGKKVTAYVASYSKKGEEAKDLIFARQAAHKLQIPLKERSITLQETEQYIKKIMPHIETSKVVHVGCALPFYLATEQAKKEGCKVIFSGFGSDEIFGGYESHRRAQNINKECERRLKDMYAEDLYRDDLVTMMHTVELRLPFLDHELVQYALLIDPKLKINGDIKKYILRKVAIGFGINKETAMRKKIAAQYGSGFDKAIEQLAKKYGFKQKEDYLKSIPQ